ncbi:hypothetical protein N644_2570 [Lactiplantibacillus paraplantarum]|nr:hypothetical protein N644_2570 [Lactiplantibacillus paraplantarum]
MLPSKQPIPLKTNYRLERDWLFFREVAACKKNQQQQLAN